MRDPLHRRDCLCRRCDPPDRPTEADRQNYLDQHPPIDLRPTRAEAEQEQ
jgi:hypothetical protein